MTAEAVPLAPAPEGWTIADVDALPENGLRYELVDGVPRVVTPPKITHQRACKRVDAALLSRGAARVVRVAGHRGGSHRRPAPDPRLRRDRHRRRGAAQRPRGARPARREVVSRSSRSDDRFREPAQYAQAGIPVHLRVELDPPHIVAYGIGEDGLYVEIGRAEPGQVLTLT